MSYRSIDNLYKNQTLLLFKEVYALEKIHGTSAHVSFRSGDDGHRHVHFYAGGAEHLTFTALFDQADLLARFIALGHPEVTVYGEAYGGKMQGMRETYGDRLRFIAFEVQIDKSWLDVLNAHDVVTKLGLEFVHYVKVPAIIETLNAERDAPSEQAKRNGISKPMMREGIVLRPPIEFGLTDGGALRAKHKRDDFRETKSPRDASLDPEKLKALADADAIAEEWVTPMRLGHVLDKLPGANIEQTTTVIAAMIEDVEREASGEIIASAAARKAISRKTALMFKARLKEALETSQ